MHQYALFQARHKRALFMPKPHATATPEGKALLRRAAAGTTAVRRGADPELTLSYVVWPGRLSHWYEQKKAA